MSGHLVREGARAYQCGGPGTSGCCAECAGYDPLAQLRADLEAVTTERDSWRRTAEKLQTELSETRKALELQTELKVIALRGEQTARAELAKAQQRSEADRKVLEACADMTEEGIDAATGQSVSVDKALAAELARRGGT